MTPETLTKLVDEIISSLEANRKGEFRGEAINWADLRCVEARRLDDTSWYVGIEEAAPESWQFKLAVENALAEHGVVARVICEW